MRSGVHLERGRSRDPRRTHPADVWTAPGEGGPLAGLRICHQTINLARGHPNQKHPQSGRAALIHPGKQKVCHRTATARPRLYLGTSPQPTPTCSGTPRALERSLNMPADSSQPPTSPSAGKHSMGTGKDDAHMTQPMCSMGQDDMGPQGSFKMPSRCHPSETQASLQSPIMDSSKMGACMEHDSSMARACNMHREERSC